MNKEKIAETALRAIISHTLGNPKGDPDGTHMRVAVMAYSAWKKMKCDTSKYDEGTDGENGDESTLDYLRGKNIYDHDFTQDVDWKGWKPIKETI